MIHKFVSRLSALTLLFVIASALPASAIIFVSPSGADGNTGLSWALAKRTIQAGCTAADAQPDKTIWVAKNDGVVLQYVENVTVPAGVLVYGSFNGDEDPLTFDINTRDFVANPSIIRPSVAATSTVTLNDGCRLDGFIVENGAAAVGAGVNCVANANCVIANCTIRNNASATSGAGLNTTAAVAGVIVTVSSCTFSGNTSDMGGAIFADGVNLIVNGSTLFDGNTERNGGAVYAANRYCSITGATFTDNLARDTAITLNSAGAGTSAAAETLIVTSCTFTDNTATVAFTPNGVAPGGGIYANGSAA
jgi:predicted outer membrane repeat protein